MKKLYIIFIFIALFLFAFILAEEAKAVSCQDACNEFGGFLCTSTASCDAGFRAEPTNTGICLTTTDKCCCKNPSPTPTTTPASGTPSTGTPAGGTPAGSAGGTASGTPPTRAGESKASTVVVLSRLEALGYKGTVPGLIGNVVKSILSFVGAFALLMVVYGGLLLLTSHGSPEGIGKGKKVITWAVIGVAVILGSYVLVDFVIKGIEGGGGGTGGGTGPGAGGGGAGTANTACTDWDSKGVCTDLRTTYISACSSKTGAALSDCVVEQNNKKSPQDQECIAGKCPNSDHGIVCCKPLTQAGAEGETCDSPNKCMLGAPCVTTAGATTGGKRNCTGNDLCCILPPPIVEPPPPPECQPWGGTWYQNCENWDVTGMCIDTGCSKGTPSQKAACRTKYQTDHCVTCTTGKCLGPFQDDVGIICCKPNP